MTLLDLSLSFIIICSHGSWPFHRLSLQLERQELCGQEATASSHRVRPLTLLYCLFHLALRPSRTLE